MNNKSNIPLVSPDFSGNEKNYLMQCLQSTWISSKGVFIDRFEKKFASYIGSKYAITASNGTAALHLSLLAYGIGMGDEVIIPDLTFVATANVVRYTGAVPVIVDVENEHWSIDTTLILNKITKKTKAIIPVHLYGHPADMNTIMGIAKKYNLIVIEDAAEAHGAMVNCKMQADGLPQWKKVGSIGDTGCFSFYGNKVMTTGEGGMITTNDAQIAKKIRILRDHGQAQNKRYFHPVIGYNYRMTNMQAAIGLAQLERINSFLIRKDAIARNYNKSLCDVKGVILQKQSEWAKKVNWLYSICLTDEYPVSRDHLIDKFSNAGIEVRPFFYPLHTLPPYRSRVKFPIASSLSATGINLPSGIHLSKEDIEKSVLLIKKQLK